MFAQITQWIAAEPAASLLMFVASVALFGSSFSRPKDTIIAFWPWLQRILIASSGVLLFLGWLWAFRTLLHRNYETFNTAHSHWMEADRVRAQAMWGQPHTQLEPTVSYFVETEVVEAIPTENAGQPPLYRNVEVRQPVLQNGLAGFAGTVDLTLRERAPGEAPYNNYLLRAQYVYQIVNASDMETEAEFSFPLSTGQLVHEDFSVTVDGEDVTARLQFAPDLVLWKSRMQPGQRSEIAVVYTSRGIESFFYRVPNQREIRNFALTLAVAGQDFYVFTDPQNEQLNANFQSDETGVRRATWRLDRVIMAPNLGIAFVQSERPYGLYHKPRLVLQQSPKGFTLLGTILVLTLLIRREPVNLLSPALLAGAYCVPFLLLAAVSDSFFGLWGSLASGVGLAGALTFLSSRRYPSRLLRVLIYGLVGFFALAYPLAALLANEAQHHTFDNLVQVGLIIYVFGLSLYTRIQHTRRPQAFRG